MPHKFQQPFMINTVEESTDIRVKYPADFALCDRHMQRIERIVLTAPWPEAIAESLEVRLVDGFQYPHQSLLCQFIFHTGHAQRSLPTICLGYPYSSYRLWPITPTMYATMQVG